MTLLDNNFGSSRLKIGLIIFVSPKFFFPNNANFNFFVVIVVVVVVYSTTPQITRPPAGLRMMCERRCKPYQTSP